MQTISQRLNAAEHAVYEQWKACGSHRKEYAAEFLGTAILLFCVVAVVGLWFSPASPGPHWVHAPVARLLLAGLMLGGAGGVIALSPLGRLSGAHLNPAVSLGFWALRKMHGRDLAGYIIAQMSGGLLGAWLGRQTLEPEGRQIKDALLVPSPRISEWLALSLEASATYLMTMVIYTALSHKRLMRWTPALCMIAVSLLVGCDGQLSGAGMNPARWFGPAALRDWWQDSAAYAFGPAVGALLAAATRRAVPQLHSVPHTAKLFHDSRFRSIFKHDAAPSTPPPLRLPAE